MSDLNRLIAAIRRVIRSEFPNYLFQGTYEYAIQKVDGHLVSLDPTDTTLGLPHLPMIPMAPSLLGEEVDPIVGAIVHVVFLNGVSTKPRITSIDAVPRSAKIGGTGPAAARFGDTIVAAGILTGTITSGSTIVSIG